MWSCEVARSSEEHERLSFLLGQFGRKTVGRPRGVIRREEFRTKNGNLGLYRWPSRKAMQAMRTRIEEILTPGYVGVAVETLAERLTPVLQG